MYEVSCCVVCRRGTKKSAELRLCQPCRARLVDQLSALPLLYKECEQVLAHPRSRSIGRISGWWPDSIPLNDAAMTVRSDMVALLASWCAMISEERSVAGPAQREVEQLAVFLRAHLDWIARHVAVADFAGEVAMLVRRARQVLRPDFGWQVELGPCTVPDCGEVVRATARGKDSASAWQVGCAMGHAWQPAQWLLLARRIDDAARRRACSEAPAGPGRGEQVA